MILNMMNPVAMNFRVAAGTAAPTELTENTLWVQTDAAVSAWAFRSGAPETAAEGNVWFQTGQETGLSLNVLKTNELTIEIQNCSQYREGVWETVSLKLWQDGQWKALADE